MASRYPTVVMRTPLCIFLGAHRQTAMYKDVWYSPEFMAITNAHKICTVLDMLKFCFCNHDNLVLQNKTVVQRLQLFLPASNKNNTLLMVLLKALTTEETMPPGLPCVVKWLPYENAPDNAAVAYKCILGAMSLLSNEPSTRYVKSAESQFTEHVPIEMHLDDVKLSFELPYFSEQYTLPVVKYLNGTYIGKLNNVFLPDGQGQLQINNTITKGLWQNGTFVRELTTT